MEGDGRRWKAMEASRLPVRVGEQQHHELAELESAEGSLEIVHEEILWKAMERDGMWKRWKVMEGDGR